MLFVAHTLPRRPYQGGYKVPHKVGIFFDPIHMRELLPGGEQDELLGLAHTFEVANNAFLSGLVILFNFFCFLCISRVLEPHFGSHLFYYVLFQNISGITELATRVQHNSTLDQSAPLKRDRKLPCQAGGCWVHASGCDVL